MTRKEATSLVAMLQGGWPRLQLPDSTIEVYAAGLADLDFELAKAAVMRLVQTSKFLPTVAEVREAAVRDRVDLPTPEEAWGIVRRAIGRHGSYISPAFDCDEVQSAVDAMGWGELCSGENPAANRARFLDAYRGFVERRMNAEARGRHVPLPRILPERDVGARSFVELGALVLVETGYATKREPELALGGHATAFLTSKIGVRQ